MNSEDDVNQNISKLNIDSIKKDEEKLKVCRQSTLELNAELEGLKKEELEDGFTYTHTDSSGARVLDDTSTINRKAIFHDLDMYRKYKESVDDTEKSVDKNIDQQLIRLPTVDETFNTKEVLMAAEKLNEMEKEIERKASIKN